jgi:hypothetical protein
MPKSQFTLILIVLGCLVLFAHPAHAFGAGNVDAGAALADKVSCESQTVHCRRAFALVLPNI